MSAEGTPSETPGHKPLTEQQRDLILAIRLLGDACEQTLSIMVQSGICDPRWTAIARTHLQEGTMSAVRAITKPDFF